MKQTIKKIYLVTVREYLRVVKNPTFWLSILLMIGLIGGISLISVYTGQESEKVFTKDLESVKEILICDEASAVSNLPPSPALVKIEDKDAGIEKVRAGESEVLIVYPADFFATKKVEIYAKYSGIFANESYNAIAESLVKQSILMELSSADKVSVFNATLKFKVTTFKDGEQIDISLEDFISPIISLFAYFTLTSFATTYLLQSVSEEKENRMIEIVLSALKPYELIVGKILGQVLVIFTQVIFLSGVSLIIFKISQVALPFDIGDIKLDFSQLAVSMGYMLFGFLFLAGMMVTTAAAMPKYRDAQQFSSFFIILSIFPIYFMMLIFADPNGTLARVLSYTPFTAPLVLTLRNSIGELSFLEKIISFPVLILHTSLSFWVASKVFEVGSLEYSQRISFKRLLKFFFKR